MEYKVLYRKYRPTCFKNIVGQEYTVKMLQNAIIHNKIAHSYLFTGPRGTGKTSTAKVFAKTINCEHLVDGEACGKCNACLSFEQSPDIIEIDAASNNGVDDIRELINNVKVAPTEGKYKIYIIDEVHMMTTSAFNALLLTLEEPPAHAIFIMATTNVESVPITILSRCQRFNFKKFSLDDLIKQIRYVCEQEKISITDEAITEIAYLSEGGMRDALSLLDQLSSLGEEITIDSILTNYGSISMKFIRDLLENVANHNISLVHESLQELANTSSDYKVFIKKIIQQLSDIAVSIATDTYTGNFSYSQIKNIIFELNDCLNKINININPFVLIEMILLGSYEEKNVKNVDNYAENVHKILEKSIEEEKKEQNSVKIEEKVDDSSNENKLQEEEYIRKMVKIRVNNCFSEAKKESLKLFQSVWEKVLDDENVTPNIKSFVLDSTVVAASDKYCILSSKLESTVYLINKNVDKISLELQSYFENPVYFVSLSEAEWKKEKQEYAKTIKNGGKYSVISESELEELKPKVQSELEEIATNVFNRDKIEMV